MDTIRAPPRETIAAFKPKRQTAYARGLPFNDRKAVHVKRNQPSLRRRLERGRGASR